jgi:hypothetical protein
MRNKPNDIRRFLTAALAAAAISACAPMTMGRPVTYLGAGPDRVGPSVSPATSASTNRIARLFRSAFLTPLPQQQQQQDQSVGNDNPTMSSTLNEVVPIPGTDMIKVGAVQEGTLFQSSFRNPTEDASNRGGGTPTSATVVFRITRP